MNVWNLWVVEMLTRKGWAPTVGSALNRAEGRLVLKNWQQRNPSDKFRLIKYVANYNT